MVRVPQWVMMSNGYASGGSPVPSRCWRSASFSSDKVSARSLALRSAARLEARSWRKRAICKRMRAPRSRVERDRPLSGAAGVGAGVVLDAGGASRCVGVCGAGALGEVTSCSRLRDERPTDLPSSSFFACGREKMVG